LRRWAGKAPREHDRVADDDAPGGEREDGCDEPHSAASWRRDLGLVGELGPHCGGGLRALRFPDRADLWLPYGPGEQPDNRNLLGIAALGMIVGFAYRASATVVFVTWNVFFAGAGMSRICVQPAATFGRSFTQPVPFARRRRSNFCIVPIAP